MSDIIRFPEELDLAAALSDLAAQADLIAVVASSDEIVHPYVRKALVGFKSNLRMCCVRLDRMFEKLDDEIRTLRAAAKQEPQPEEQSADA